MRWLTGTAVALWLAWALPAHAVSKDQAEAILDQLLARYPIELLDTPRFQTTDGDAVRIQLPLLRQEIGGIRGVDHLVLRNGEATISGPDAQGSMLVDVTLPPLAELRNPDNEKLYTVVYGEHSIRLHWNSDAAEPAGLDAEMAALSISGKTITDGKLDLDGLSLQWRGDSISGRAGRLVTVRFADMRGLRFEQAGFSLERLADERLTIDMMAEDFRSGLPFTPRDLALAGHLTGTDWPEVNEILSRAVDHFLSGEPAAAVGRDATRDLLALFRADSSQLELTDLRADGIGYGISGTGDARFDAAAFFGGVAMLDLLMTGRTAITALIGTPERPTLIGALVPDLVRAIALGEEVPGGTAYQVDLSEHGEVSINGTSFSTFSR